VNLALTKDPNHRPSAQDLLVHPFLSPFVDSQEIIKALLNRSQEVKRQRSISRDDHLNDSFDFDGIGFEKNPSNFALDVNLKEKEKTEPINNTLPSLPIKKETSMSFKAERICRLGFPVNCAQFWSNF
jgi:serine/threonine protein kinase